MLDLNLVEFMGLLKSEPGAGFVNTVLLVMIWWNSRKISKKLDAHGEILTDPEVGHTVRIKRLENKVFGDRQRTT